MNTYQGFLAQSQAGRGAKGGQKMSRRNRSNQNRNVGALRGNNASRGVATAA